MAYFYISKIRNEEYIYGGISYRRPYDGRPIRLSKCLGKVEPLTRIPILNKKFEIWINQYEDKLDKSFEQFANEKQLNIVSNSNRTMSSNIPQNEDIDKEVFSIRDIIQSECKHFGATYLLSYVSNKIGLTDILSQVFPNLHNELLTLAQFYTIDPDPLLYCKNFSRTHYTSASSNSVTSQRISEICSNITETQRNLFYQTWSQFVQENDNLALDTTSISTYSTQIDKAEYGKPKQADLNKHKKQVNLCLLFGENTGLPVFSPT
jgi:hypothetical protein